MTLEQEQLLKKAHASLLAARVLEREEMYDFSASRSYYAHVLCSSSALARQGAVVSSSWISKGRVGILEAYCIITV